MIADAKHVLCIIPFPEWRYPRIVKFLWYVLLTHPPSIGKKFLASRGAITFNGLSLKSMSLRSSQSGVCPSRICNYCQFVHIHPCLCLCLWFIIFLTKTHKHSTSVAQFFELFWFPFLWFEVVHLILMHLTTGVCITSASPLTLVLWHC